MSPICAVHNESQDRFVALQQNFPDNREARLRTKVKVHYFNQLCWHI
jgi:hypothetical protein